MSSEHECMNCAFWRWGTCRRYPPVLRPTRNDSGPVLVNDDLKGGRPGFDRRGVLIENHHLNPAVWGAWPLTSPHDWCASWKEASGE